MFTQRQGFCDAAARNPLPDGRNTLPDMRKKTTAETLAENLTRLMAGAEDLNSDRKLAKVSGVSHKTINNILNGRHDVGISNVEKIAKAFRIDAFQLLCPQIDATFLQVCRAYSYNERGKDLLAAVAETVLRDDRPNPKHGESQRG